MRRWRTCRAILDKYLQGHYIRTQMVCRLSANKLHDRKNFCDHYVRMAIDVEMTKAPKQARVESDVYSCRMSC